jgi:glycosyltransferase involved in cell wall biosynthesis
VKLIVQIPCLNEEATLPLVVRSIPRQIPGIDVVEVLVIDDGSTDRTVEVARELGVDHIVSNTARKGLAHSFAAGLHEALRQGADIIVNTDGDNQYPQEAIPALVAPILAGTADMVVADRQVRTIQHFSPAKRLLQRVGSRVVNLAAGTQVADAASGFRAYSREAAIRLNVVTDFSYAMETLVSAGRKRLAIAHVPVQTNPKTRESRLFGSMLEHVARSAGAILRSYAMFRAFSVFLLAGALFVLLGTLPYLRLLYWVAVRSPEASGHVQSLIAGAVLILFGIVLAVLGVVADLLSVNRRLIEDVLLRLKRLEYGESTGPGPDGPPTAADLREAFEGLGAAPVSPTAAARPRRR